MELDTILRIFFTIFCFIFSIFTFIYGEYKGCFYPIPIYNGINSLQISVIMGVSVLSDIGVQNPLMGTLRVLLTMMLLVSLLISHLLLFINIGYTPNCLDLSDISFSMTALTLVNYVTVYIAIFGFYLIFHNRGMMFKSLNATNECKKIYDNIYSMRRGEINEFIMENTAFMNESSLNDKERAILFDKYSRKV